MADSKKNQNDELSLQEPADLLDVHYILADPLRGPVFTVGDLGADTTAASFAKIVTNEAQTIAVGIVISVAADDLLRHRNRHLSWFDTMNASS
ncbi:MAG: hypothetical protein M3Q30_03370 [Actinomycetota bacterium]|nr:hypothetical protein [Actinomycetota bacterium]